MTGTVNVGSEGASLRGELADLGQGEHLEAAAVGQNRSVPVLELMQSAGLSERVQTGAEIEVIGVSEYDFSAYIFL
jgi:hypothetical protein